jgi:hypothetical protein
METDFADRGSIVSEFGPALPTGLVPFVGSLLIEGDGVAVESRREGAVDAAEDKLRLTERLRSA